MEDGYIKLFRKLLKSRVFQNEGLLKVWVWCLLKAGYEGRWVSIKTGRGKTEVWLEPGEFIFGRHTASRELRMKPSTVWERILKLKDMVMISIRSESHYSILSVLNWALYQAEEPRQMPLSEKDSKTDRQPDTQGEPESLDEQASSSEHGESLTGNPTPNRQATDTNKKVKNIKRTPEEIFSEIALLKQRYSDPQIIDQCLDAIRTTRKRGKVSDSVILSILQACEQYTVEQVQGGIRIYLSKGHAQAGKREEYLFGIIKRQNGQESKGQGLEAGFKSTGSALLDDYNKNPEKWGPVQ